MFPSDSIERFNSTGGVIGFAYLFHMNMYVFFLLHLMKNFKIINERENSIKYYLREFKTLSSKLNVNSLFDFNCYLFAYIIESSIMK